jgi:hypothetical protein
MEENRVFSIFSHFPLKTPIFLFGPKSASRGKSLALRGPSRVGAVLQLKKCKKVTKFSSNFRLFGTCFLGFLAGFSMVFKNGRKMDEIFEKK